MRESLAIDDLGYDLPYAGGERRSPRAARARRRAPALRAPTPPPPVPLIGRERESDELRVALEAALCGSGALVLLGGEPGIGKTRLAGALAEEAEERGVPVWCGRCWEDGSAPAFWPWSTALRRWIGRVGHERAVAAAAPWAADLSHVFPALREAASAPVAVASPGGDGCEPDGARFRQFDAVSRFLAAVAEPAGLVVVLDDFGWADRPSLKLLEFVAAGLAEARVLVVGTYRDTEVRRGDPLFDTLSRVARETGTRRMSVAGLSRADCARWLGLVGLESDAPALAGALHRETNGNPFFVGEIVHLLARGEGLGADPDGRLPHGVREVIARRLDRLGDECRRVLEVAALFGDTIDAHLLARTLDDVPQADHLERAVRDRILVEGDGAGQYRFAHALIRRDLAGELHPSARAGWHARIAAALERHAPATEAVTTELVRHLAAAGTPDALRSAFAHARRGAEQAARGLGWEEAVRLYEVALDVGARSGSLDAACAAGLELGLARALRGAGDVPAARARCTSVMATCRATGDATGFARAALIYAGPIPEWGRVEPAVRAVLQDACRGAAQLDDALRARLHGRLAGDLVAANETEQEARVYALCDDAAAAARRAGDDGALAVALTGIYYAAAMGMRRGATGEPVPRVEQILAAAEAGGEHELGAAIRHTRAMGLLARGAPEAFSSEVDALATAAAASRVPEAVWLAEGLVALRATVRGRFAEAERAIERTLATGRRSQVPNAYDLYMSQRIMWHAFRGRLAEIAAEIDAFVADAPGGAGWRPFRALARLASGDAVTARGELDAMVASGLARAERGEMARCYLAGLAALCVGLRDRELAAELHDRLARREDAWSADGSQTLGPWALVLGGLARTCGRTEDAVGHLERAIRLGRRMGSPPVVARAQSMLASALLALEPDADGRARVAAALGEAARTAEDLGLVDVAARVARLEARLAPDRSTQQDVRNSLRCEGDVWTVRFGGRDLRIRDGKGARYLATLLSAPDREFHVLELAGGAPAAPLGATSAEDGLTVCRADDAIEDAPDAHARRQYRTRVADLRAELEEAEQLCDAGRAERIREELDFLVAQLAQTFGSHARKRGPAETARKAVTKVLRTQIGKLLETHAPLGEHLRDSVRMGTFCAYAPRSPVGWDIAFTAG